MVTCCRHKAAAGIPAAPLMSGSVIKASAGGGRFHHDPAVPCHGASRVRCNSSDRLCHHVDWCCVAPQRKLVFAACHQTIFRPMRCCSRSRWRRSGVDKRRRIGLPYNGGRHFAVAVLGWATKLAAAFSVRPVWTSLVEVWHAGGTFLWWGYADPRGQAMRADDTPTTLRQISSTYIGGRA